MNQNLVDMGYIGIRMLLNRGYKSHELYEEEKKHMRPLGPGNMPTIVPVSSSAA